MILGLQRWSEKSLKNPNFTSLRRSSSPDPEVLKNLRLLTYNGVLWNLEKSHVKVAFKRSSKGSRLLSTMAFEEVIQFFSKKKVCSRFSKNRVHVPSIIPKKRLKIILHKPLKIHVYDTSTAPQEIWKPRVKKPLRYPLKGRKKFHVWWEPRPLKKPLKNSFF